MHLQKINPLNYRRVSTMDVLVNGKKSRHVIDTITVIPWFGKHVYFVHSSTHFMGFK